METRRPRLLLADDSATIQKVVTLTFTDEGMDVIAFGAGDQAIRFMEESGPPDVVLADVHMPGLSGYEVCERVKRDPRWRRIPVILLAGAFEPFDEAEARRVGADDVLSKPFQSIRGLIGKVGSLLGGGAQHEADARADEQPSRGAEARAAAHESPRDDPFEETLDSKRPVHEAARESAPEPFANFGMDDQLIEATPAEAFGAHAAETAHEPQPVLASESEQPQQQDESAAPVWATEQNEMTAQSESTAFSAAPREVAAETNASVEPRPAAAEAQLSASASSASAPRAFAAHAAGAAAADEALLDIGVIDAPAHAAEADDFVLDIDLDEPPPPPRPRRESEARARVDAPSAFAEAAHGFGAAEVAREAAPRHEAFTGSPAPRDFVEPQVVPAEEPQRPDEDLSVEGDVARAPVSAQQEIVEAFQRFAPQDAAPAETREGGAATSAAAQASAERGLDPQQLAPEVIEQIARRAVELMSERIVQEIAWEVVPALSERLITQRLDELARKE